MNKKDFIDEVAKRCMITPYVVDEIYNVSFGLVSEKLIAGEQVEIPKLGKFIVKGRERIEYDNLFGKGKQVVEAYSYPSFSVSNGLKNRVKNGRRYPKTP